MIRTATYSDLLKDVRWQKQRLEVFQRDGWACRRCGCSAGSMHVHHAFYDTRDPWDYPDGSLTTLCSECHDLIEMLKKCLKDRNAVLPQRDVDLKDWEEGARRILGLDTPKADDTAAMISTALQVPLLPPRGRFGQGMIEQLYALQGAGRWDEAGELFMERARELCGHNQPTE